MARTKHTQRRPTGAVGKGGNTGVGRGGRSQGASRKDPSERAMEKLRREALWGSSKQTFVKRPRELPLRRGSNRIPDYSGT